MLHDKKEGIDYFTSQEDLKQYAKLHLGWMGGGVSVGADMPNDAELVERVKKRKRRATLKAADLAKAKSSSQMKKDATNSAKGAAKQQTCNRLTKGIDYFDSEEDLVSWIDGGWCFGGCRLAQ